MRQYKVLDPNFNEKVKCGDIVIAVKAGHRTYTALVKDGWVASRWHNVPESWIGKHCWSFNISDLEPISSINDIYEN